MTRNELDALAALPRGHGTAPCSVDQALKAVDGCLAVAEARRGGSGLRPGTHPDHRLRDGRPAGAVRTPLHHRGKRRRARCPAAGAPGGPGPASGPKAGFLPGAVYEG